VPGEILKKRREELGYNLKEIAKTLRIRSDYLKAIEEETFEKLPVEVYTKGYIREYAKFLKTDPAVVIKAYTEKISPPPVIEKEPAPEENTEKEKKQEGKEKTTPKYFVILIASAAAAVIGFLIVSFMSVLSPKERATPVSKSAITVPPALQPNNQEQKAIEKEKTLKEHSLEILASDTTWLLVTADNTESKELLLNKGGSAKFSAKKGFTLKIGNAGGVKLIFDGKDMGAPGESGKVITLNIPSGNSPRL